MLRGTSSAQQGWRVYVLYSTKRMGGDDFSIKLDQLIAQHLIFLLLFHRTHFFTSSFH